MNEDFVTFDLAKKLKEKGFDKPCVAYYVSSCSKLYFNITQLRGCSVEDCFISRNTQQGFNGMTLTDAPTISQVLKWLREENNIYCLPWFEQGVDMWFYAICKPAYACEFPEFMSESDYDTYEEAALAGIEYVLDKLI